MLASSLEAVPLEAPLCQLDAYPAVSPCYPPPLLPCLDVHAQIDMKVLQIGEQLGGCWSLLWLTVPAAVHDSKAREKVKRDWKRVYGAQHSYLYLQLVRAIDRLLQPITSGQIIGKLEYVHLLVRHLGECDQLPVEHAQ